MSLALDLVGDTCIGDPTCGAFLEKWGAWADKHSNSRMALLWINKDYVALLDPKSRNMLRKSQRAGYTYAPFTWNERLDEIHDINLSKPVRSGGPMTDNYRKRPTPSQTTTGGCPLHRTVYMGAFRAGRLKAYCVLAVVNELAVVNQILGHADALPDGVMNGLVKALHDFCLDTSVTHINYLSLESSPEGLARFKRSVGFESREATLNHKERQVVVT